MQKSQLILLPGKITLQWPAASHADLSSCLLLAVVLCFHDGAAADAHWLRADVQQALTTLLPASMHSSVVPSQQHPEQL